MAIEKNGFKIFKQFDTEKNMKHAARVMQLSIQIPQTMLFIMVNDTHHVINREKKPSSG